MNDLIKAFANLGIAIKYTDGTFREFGNVMLDLAEIWDKLQEQDNNLRGDV